MVICFIIVFNAVLRDIINVVRSINNLTLMLPNKSMRARRHLKAIISMVQLKNR